MLPINKRFLQYFVGILLLICSFPLFAEGGKGIIGGLFMLTGGLICMPATLAYIEQELDFRFAKWFKYFVVILGFYSISIFGKSAERAYTGATSQPLFSDQQDKAITQDKEPTTEVKKTESSITTQVVVTTTTNPQTAENFENDDDDNDTESLDNTAEDYTTVAPALTRPQKVKAKRNSYSSGRREYIRGPRGGCYYINGNGNKTYVDRSLCD